MLNNNPRLGLKGIDRIRSAVENVGAERQALAAGPLAEGVGATEPVTLRAFHRTSTANRFRQRLCEQGVFSSESKRSARIVRVDREDFEKAWRLLEEFLGKEGDPPAFGFFHALHFTYLLALAAGAIGGALSADIARLPYEWRPAMMRAALFTLGGASVGLVMDLLVLGYGRGYKPQFRIGTLLALMAIVAIAIVVYRMVR